jgi:hypothetical protein
MLVRLTIVSALNMTGTGSRICTRHIHTVIMMGKAVATAVDRNTKSSKHRMVASMGSSSSYMPSPEQQQEMYYKHRITEAHHENELGIWSDSFHPPGRVR